MVVIIFLAILAIFLILSRRKLAYFVLAILAGVVLNQYLNAEIVKILTLSNLQIPNSTLVGIAGLTLILTPALILLPKNSKQESWLFGVISSIFASIFVLSVSHLSLSRVFVFDELSKNLALLAENYTGIIILAAVVLAILSIFSIKTKKDNKKS